MWFRTLMRLNGRVVGLLFTLIDREKDNFHHGWIRYFVTDKEEIGDVSKLVEQMKGHAC